ncbi:ran-binding protein 1 homolog a-like isoform X2 [Cicer arietinum]|nr:ran-binding protein 1 homolog a-like isoform X2 [Cicer arietinum]
MLESCGWHARDFADGELKDEFFCICFSSIENQDDARHKFGQSGGFTCPFVPLLRMPTPTCIPINSYLLINLGRQ